jgi:hypothetical protein
MNEPLYEYNDNGTTFRSEVPLFNGYCVGDLVTWTADGDIGIVTNMNAGDYENIFIEWTVDSRASGWHAPHPSLKLLSSPRNRRSTHESR